MTQATKPSISVNTGIKIATRHPQRCVELLANHIYPVLEKESWFSKEWQLRFFAYFLQNIGDQSIEAEVEPELMARIRRVPLNRAISLIENCPCSGLKVLVSIISQQLRQEQHLSEKEQYAFYNVLFEKFFPDQQRTAIRQSA